MRKPISDCYGSRLKAAMDQHNCKAPELAHACGCTQVTIHNACKDHNDRPLSTEYHFRAAFYLQQDPVRLLTGNALPIRQGLEGAIARFTLDEYQDDPVTRESVHKMLAAALKKLPVSKRRKTVPAKSR